MKANAILAVPVLLAVSMCAHSEAPAASAKSPASTAATTTATAAAAPAATTTATTVAAADATTISIREFMFAPTSMTVAVGTTVKWQNLDGEPHTVRSVDTSFSSNPLDQNDSFAFKFDKPGTYKYVCSIHPQMVGTIVVKAAN
jgi:plastocyanin